MENKFELVEEDYYALEIAKKIARHFLSLPIVKPKQIIGLGNAIFALERIPKSTPGVFVNYGVELCKGNNDFRESAKSCPKRTPVLAESGQHFLSKADIHSY